MSATKNINAEKIQGSLTADTINIQTLGSGTSVTNLGIDSSGNVVTGTTGGGGDNFYVTGFTYNDSNTFTISQNGGLGDLTSTINTMTGLTVNGTLVVDTISATTINGSISGLTLNDLDDVTTGIPASPDNTYQGELVYFDVTSNQWVSGAEYGNLGEVTIWGKKGSTGTIDKGCPVYITGFDNDIHEIELANASTGSTMPVIGFTAEDFDNAGIYPLITFGKLSGIDTTSGSTTLNPFGETWEVNDVLYMSKTDGGLTKFRPTGTNTQIQRIAKVLNVGTTNGQIFIFNTARTAGLPNLTTGYLWVGNGDDLPQEVIKTDVGITTTGFTYNDNNTFTITDDNGGSYSATINQMSGLTVTGNVGIGTTTPSHKLSIIGSNGSFETRVDGSLPYTSEIYAKTTNPSGSSVVQIVNDNVSSIVMGVLGSNRDASIAYGGESDDAFMFASTAANNLHIFNNSGTGTEDSIKFYAGNTATSTPHLHIQGSGSTKGYVGIGTETPIEKLDVVGNTKISGTLNVGTLGTGTSVNNLGLDVNGNVVSGNTNTGIYGGDGTIPLNTTASVNGDLTFQGLDEDTRIILKDGNNGGEVHLFSDGSAGQSALEFYNPGGVILTSKIQNAGGDTRYISNNRDLLFATSTGVTTEGFFIEAGTGNMGIGTTTPSEKLDVVGNTKVSGTLNIGTLGTGTSVNNLGIDASGNVVNAGGGDIYVTGGTYSSGTLTLDRNDGNSVSVSGFTSGNANVDNFYYSISNSVDTRPIFEDTNVLFNWDETGNDLEFRMKVAPGGSGDMRSLAYLVGGSTQNTFITTTGVNYDVYTSGVSAGNRLEVFITAENDVTYPAYHVIVYNTGESVQNTVWIQRITKN